MSSYRSIPRIVFSATDSMTGPSVCGRADGGACALRRAAKLVENTAFSEAGDQPASVISQLILLSADLERLAQTLERSESAR